MPADDPVLMELTKGQPTAATCGAGIVGAFVPKELSKIWSGIRDDKDHLIDEVIKLTRETVEAQKQVAISVEAQTLRLEAKFDTLIRSLPKRDGDKNEQH